MNFLIRNTTIIAIFAGFVLDSILGDPQNPYHPIRLIGFVIARFISLYKKLKIKNNKLQYIYGALMTITVVMAFYFGTRIFLDFIYRAHIIAGVILESMLCYFLISTKALYRESEKINNHLYQNDLPGARKRLSLIVGRDTGHLNEEKIVQATVETVSENLSDGVIGPLLFMFLGGSPLGMAYKAINTLDSMVGYHNETFENFGKFAAKLDDFVNLVPARLSAIFMVLASSICKNDTKSAIKIYIRDRYNHLSPNSAHTEAVCAGALGIQLGGTSVYKGKAVEKPTIGDSKRSAVIGDIKNAAVLMYVSAILALLFGIIIYTLLEGLFYV